MGKIQSQIHHRSLQVPLTTRLVFDSFPTSTSEPLGRVAEKKENQPYLEFRSWLEDTLAAFDSTFLPIGHKDADARRSANIRSLKYQLERLDKIVSWSWDHAKVQAHVPGYYMLAGSKTLKLVTPRKQSDLSS